MSEMKRRTASLCCVVFVGLGLCGSVRAEEKDPAAREFVSAAQRKAAAALLKKHQEAVSTSTQGLVQVKSSVPDGGIVVRLNGRFRNTMVARIDSSGVTADCGSGTLDVPASAERKE
jgi:hypothetical protein